MRLGSKVGSPSPPSLAFLAEISLERPSTFLTNPLRSGGLEDRGYRGFPEIHRAGVSFSQFSLALVSERIAIAPEGAVLIEGDWGDLSAILPHVNRVEVARRSRNSQAVTEDPVLGSPTRPDRGAFHRVSRSRLRIGRATDREFDQPVPLTTPAA
jgi:hypothetical protein